MPNLPLQSYRAIFAKEQTLKTDYWNNFKEVLEWYPLIRKITDYAKSVGIEYIWFFYEPYIEITWLTKDSTKSTAVFKFVENICKQNDITDLQKIMPEELSFADWFCKSEAEKEFGGRRHDICRQWVDLYNDYKGAVDDGKGLEEQVKRTIHTLCNPLALNFNDEARICFSRWICVKLFRCVKPRWLALWIYTKIFRQKY